MSSEAAALGLANQWGPILFGIVYGLIIGYKIDSEEINKAKYPIILISALLIAMDVRQQKKQKNLREK